jgi:hypothetical protein
LRGQGRRRRGCCVQSRGPSPSPSVGKGDVDPENDKAFAWLWAYREQLARFDKIILATGGDRPGMVLRDELALRLGGKRCWFVRYPSGCKDANEVLGKLGTDALAAVIASALPMVPESWSPLAISPLGPTATGSRAAGPNSIGT